MEAGFFLEIVTKKAAPSSETAFLILANWFLHHTAHARIHWHIRFFLFNFCKNAFGC